MSRFRNYIRTVLLIFKRDAKRLLRNPVALVIIFGVCLLPSLYALYVVAANWNPYANTESIKVAVANADEGATSDMTGKLNVGDQVVAKLHDDHQLGWQFVDQQQAEDGVRSGQYYAAIVIPKSFSADFISVFSGHFTQPTLDYYVNEKYSSVAPKVTDAGAQAVQKAIDSSFVSTVSETVLEMSQKVGDAVEARAADADGALTASVARARDAIDRTRQLVEGLAPAIAEAQGSVASAHGTVSSLQGQLPGLVSSLEQAQGQLQHIRSIVQEYGAQASQRMADSAVALGRASAQANSAIGRVSGSLSQAQAAVGSALAEGEALAEQLQAVVANPPADLPANAQAALQQALDDVETQLAELRTLNDSLSATIAASDKAMDTIDQAVQEGATGIQSAASTFQGSILPQVSASLDSFADVLGQLAGAARALDPLLAEAAAVLDQMDVTLGQASQASQLATSSLTTVQQSLDSTLADLRALQASANENGLSTYLSLNPDDVAQFMASPVSLNTVPVYPVANYGSGVAPFFTNLALWVAGFILMAMVKLRVDPAGLPKFTATQAYFGRWLLYVVLGLIQGLVVCVGDLLLGIQCTSPAAFIGAGLLGAFTYVNLMYALAYAFRHIGKAIAVLLLIMQIPGASGMFPVEMMPQFYQIIHPLLPFTYCIDAMREAIGGFYGFHYLQDMLALGLMFIPLGFFIGLVVGRYDFNLNMLFDTKLSRSRLYVSEEVPEGATRFRKSTMLRALLNTADYRKRVIARAASFKRRYPALIKVGWVAIFAQPVLTFIVMALVKASVDVKVILLVGMVIGIIVVDVYLIVVSYLKADLDYQLSLASADDADLADEVRKSLSRATPDARSHRHRARGRVKNRPGLRRPGRRGRP